MSTTVRIPPRAYSYRSGYSSITVTSAGSCYTNVDSTTYATFNSQYYSTSSDIFAIHLRNFDLSLVPEDADITRLYLKLKMRRSNSALASGFRPAACLNSSSGQTYSFGTWSPLVTSSNSTAITTFQIPVTNSTSAKSVWSTIKSMGANFSIAINIGRSNPAYYYVYGAEIAVTYNEKNINKVVYGDKTLIDLTSDTIDASKMLSGITAHDKYGAVITGTISTKTSSNVTFSNTTVTVPSGYYASQVSKTATDADLVAENIKKDINIFGVTGTYEGESSTEAIADDVSTLPSGGEHHNIIGVDISQDTVTARTLVKDYTAHDAEGNAITGIFEGGEIEYEEGTINLPTTTSNYDITFSNAHTSLPTFYIISRASNAVYVNTFISTVFSLTENIGVPQDENYGVSYGAVAIVSIGSSSYLTSNVIRLTKPSSNLSGSDTSYPRYWATETRIRIQATSSKPIGGTYKWLAVWNNFNSTGE